jgi:hypothetical protein
MVRFQFSAAFFWRPDTENIGDKSLCDQFLEKLPLSLWYECLEEHAIPLGFYTVSKEGISTTPRDSNKI